MFIFTYIITSKSQNISRNTTSPGKAKCGPPLISRTANRIPMLTLTWGENVSFPCRGLGIFGGMELNYIIPSVKFYETQEPKFKGKFNPTIILFYTVFHPWQWKSQREQILWGPSFCAHRGILKSLEPMAHLEGKSMKRWMGATVDCVNLGHPRGEHGTYCRNHWKFSTLKKLGFGHKGATAKKLQGVKFKETCVTKQFHFQTW